MDLKRKFLLKNLVPLAGLLLMGAASLWGLRSLRADVRDALAGGQELRTVDGAAARVAKARSASLASKHAVQEEAQLLADVESDLGSAVYGKWAADDAESRGYGDAVTDLVKSALAHLGRAESALGQFGSDPATPPPARRQEMLAGLDGAHRDLSDVVRACHTFIDSRNQRADRKVATAATLLLALFGVTLLASGLSSYSQYRAVVVPLNRLREGVRRVANAEFGAKVNEEGGREFAELAAEFNRMAAELDDFYQQLEEKVRAKSKELVRSERLASAGFLAAGVAHEINTPLNIISGYAELSARRLKQAADGAPCRVTAAEVLQSLHVIRDEAFRCKDITEKLLSLAKGGKGHDGADEAREELSLAEVAREVADLTKGLKNYRDRHVSLRLPPEEPLAVVARRAEMKQVLLNLTVNALEAVPPGAGEVCIEGRRTRDWVELRVRDNGRGMRAEILEHVFEPFFSDQRRPDGARGTGLGLSITHAIIEDHGGRIAAASAGPGRGSEFTVRLPAPRGPQKC